MQLENRIYHIITNLLENSCIKNETIILLEFLFTISRKFVIIWGMRRRRFSSYITTI